MDQNPDFDEDRNLPFVALDRRQSRMFENQAGWSGDNTETIAATIIANSLPGIMINSMYSCVQDLVLNTRARMNEPKVVVGKPFPYVPGMSIRASMPYFESQVEHVLLEEISKGGMFDVEARIDANIDQEIRIWISIDDGEEAHFVFPAFADSLVAPTLDTAMGSIDTMSKGIINLASTLSNRRHNQAPSYVDKPGIITGSERTEPKTRGAAIDLSPNIGAARKQKRGNSDF